MTQMNKSQKYEKSPNTVRERWTNLFRLLKLISSMAKKEVTINLVITLLSGFIPLLAVFALQRLVDTVVLAANEPSEYFKSAMFWTGMLILSGLLNKVSSIYGGMIQNHIQELIKEKVQRSMIEKAQKLSLGEFERAQIYDQLQRANQGLDHRLFSTMSFIFRMLTRIVTVISLLVYLVFFHWLIPIIMLIGSIIFTLVQIRLWTEKYLLERKQTTDNRKLQYIEGLITGRPAAAEVRLFHLGDYLVKSWNQLNVIMREERLNIAKREYRFSVISSSGNTLTFGVVLSGIVYLGTAGVLGVGHYAAFIRSVLYFQDELTGLFWEVAIVNNDLRYIQDFFEYMDTAEENTDGEKMNIATFQKEIKFVNVSFAYPGSKEPVLKDVNLTIKKGERIALVGGNGSGKTTLIKLLLGLYQPTSGAILIDGIDLKNTNLSTWREKTTAIFQDFQKYSLTIQENIAIGQNESAEQVNKVKIAAELSGAAPMIEAMKDGYSTFLGKEFNGKELSQGQWQKIAIARAYYRQSDVLVLDEPTAALDPKAEVEIYNQFQEVSLGKTVMFISHRLGVAKLADRILVLAGGKIEEQGRHTQLLKKKGTYAEMFTIQQQWYES